MDKEQEGVVIEVVGNIARVKTSRHNDCANCGACPGNSAMVLEANNLLAAKPGQRVLVEVKQVNMLKAAFIVYILPLIAAFAGAAAGGWLAARGDSVVWFQVGGGVLAFLLAVGYVKYFDRQARGDIDEQPCVTKILS